MTSLAASAPSQTVFTESAASQRARGKLARQAVSREALGEYVATGRDAVELVTYRNDGRLEQLVPLRHFRMAASPFAFYRGTAGLMAFDLSHQAQTGVQIVICGDAHLSNFGLYASPERRLVFDLNDFDEAAPGPWEWDVKRLVTSAILAAREIGADVEDQERIASQCVAAYRRNLAELLELPALARHYYSVDSTLLAENVRESGLKQFKKTTAKARRRDSDRAIEHLMAPDNMGYIRFRDDPPILTHIRVEDEQRLARLLSDYRESTHPEINYLLSRFSLSDVAQRVVGVGSVGTRCYVAALTGPEGRGLMLQVKEAGKSVITQFSEPNITTPQTLRDGMNMGERVTSHQRILQSVSDPFLGHMQADGRDFYVRQFRDAKGSFDTSIMDPIELGNYASLCGGILARAHAQSPFAHWIGGYIGKSKVFDRAIVSWCSAYADQAESDYLAFVEAIETGRLEACDLGSEPAAD